MTSFWRTSCSPTQLRIDRGMPWSSVGASRSAHHVLGTPMSLLPDHVTGQHRARLAAARPAGSTACIAPP
ncbi:hypothetical protein BRO20_04080, partial [Xanthomonas oryzae pv. oryzae]